MRISELAATTGVSLATLKYYLRERLLHPGAALSATRADYDESHVERVRLVRTLVEVGHLSIDRVREVVAALDNPPPSRHELLGTAHEVLRDGDARAPISEEAQGLVDTVLAGSGCDASAPAARALARAVMAAQAGGWPLTPAALRTWSQGLRTVAETDVVPELAELSPSEALRYAIVGNVLTDPIIIALRRVEQERVSAQRLGVPGQHQATDQSCVQAGDPPS